MLGHRAPVEVFCVPIQTFRTAFKSWASIGSASQGQKNQVHIVRSAELSCSISRSLPKHVALKPYIVRSKKVGSCSVPVHQGQQQRLKALVYLGHPRGGGSRAWQPGRWLHQRAAGTAMSRATLLPRQGYVTSGISAFTLSRSAAGASCRPVIPLTLFAALPRAEQQEL